MEMRLSSAAAPGVVGAGRVRPSAQDVELAPGVGARAPARSRIARRLVGEAHAHLGADRAEMGGERVGILGDVGRVHPLRAAADHGEFGELALGPGDEGVGLGRGRRGCAGRGAGADGAAARGRAVVGGRWRRREPRQAATAMASRETVLFMAAILDL